MKSRSQQTRYRASGPIPGTRLGRIVWLTVAVIFLSLVAMGIWLWVRSIAEPGISAGRQRAATQASVTEAEAVNMAAFLPSHPSPFRAEGTPKIPPDTDVAPGDGISPRKDEIIYHRRKNDRMEIALSFDDGPHPYYTPIILDILAEYGIHATFFMVGENVTYYPAAAESVVVAGHEIGNHTFSHRGFSRMNEHEVRSEIAACEDAIASVSECRPHFIRPPEGELSEAMRRVIGALDYRIVLWDVDTRDWAHTPPDTICQHILDTVQAGDIILMHDFIGHDSPTPEALRLVIPALLDRGYRFVTVGELVDGS